MADLNMLLAQRLAPDDLRQQFGRGPATLPTGAPDPDATGGLQQAYADWQQRGAEMPPTGDWLSGLPMQGLGFVGGLKVRGGPGDLLRERAVPEPSPAPAEPTVPGASLETAPGVEDRVSTRIPTAKGGTADPHSTADLVIDSDAVRSSPDAFNKNMARVRMYPDLQAAGLADNDAIAAEFMGNAERRLKFLHRALLDDPRIGPEGVQRMSRWYDGGNSLVLDRADKTGLEPRQMAGVYATQSPQKDWYQNVSLGDRIVSIARDQQNTNASPEMRGWMEQFLAGKEKELAKDAAAGLDVTKRVANLADQRITANSAGRGRLRDMNDPDARAMWIRAYDEAHNSRQFSIVTPEGELLGPQLTGAGEPSKVGWGGFGDLKKALAIMDDPSLPNISRNLGSNHKVRNFYNNLISPNAPFGDVTIDTHAINAAHLIPMGGEHPIVSMGLGTGGAKDAASGSKGLYGLYADVNRKVGADLGLQPRQVQSVTWEGVRGLFEAAAKRDKGFNDANGAVWNAYRRGDITHDQAMQHVLEQAGGITPPNWLWSP